MELMTVLAGLVVVIVAGKIGGAAFARLGQPVVLGELLAGVVLGNLSLAGIHALDPVRHSAGLDLLGHVGVLFLLFTVGVRTDLRKLAQVGGSAALVATLGVIAPGLLGWLTARLLMPGQLELVYVFVGAILCATSVGITARVLEDLRKTDSAEGRIILGAAVIDDVLGLIVLAVLSGVIRAADRGIPMHWSAILATVAGALAFLAAALFGGRWVARGALALAARFPGEGMLLPLALAFCFGLSYLAGRMGLAPIVGAFAAGLILDETRWRDASAGGAGQGLDEQLAPLNSFLVPVFFVLMGMRVDLTVFADAGVIALALALTLAAVVGKQLCAAGVLERGVDRLAVGLGMIPRGEVGLIFAGIGVTLTVAGRRVVDDAVYSAAVAMVTLTTLMTPPLLAWRLRRSGGGRN